MGSLYDFLPNEAVRFINEYKREYRIATDDTKNPNQTLVDFFKDQGEKPLNPIELSGCVKLLRDYYGEKREERDCHQEKRKLPKILPVPPLDLAYEEVLELLLTG